METTYSYETVQTLDLAGTGDQTRERELRRVTCVFEPVISESPP